MSSELLTADELAAMLGVNRRRVMEWQHQYGWPHVRIGRTFRWTPEQVEQIKAKHTVSPAGLKPADGRTVRSARRSA